MEDLKKKEKKVKKVKKQKSNQSSVDFCIMTAAGDVKEVVKKKKRDASGKVKESSSGGGEEAAAAPKAPLTAEEKAAKKARKEAKRAKKEAKVEAKKRAAAATAAADGGDGADGGAVAEEDRTTPSSATAASSAAGASRGSARSGGAASNPSGVTRLFVGNLPWSITDEDLAKGLGQASLPVIKYITDKESGKFYGSAFVDVGGDAAAAAAAVAMNGSLIGGRPIKVAYAPPRPGDVWPPVAGDSKSRKGTTPRERTPRPEGGSFKLFVGNVAYEATDDDVTAIFKDVAPEGLSAIRWVTHKDTGDFKGCGYLQFHSVDQADAAVELTGTKLHGRPIRLDYCQ